VVRRNPSGAFEGHLGGFQVRTALAPALDLEGLTDLTSRLATVSLRGHLSVKPAALIQGQPQAFFPVGSRGAEAQLIDSEGSGNAEFPDRVR